MFKRICPECEKTLEYKNKRKFLLANKLNNLCRSCGKKGKKNPMFGKLVGNALGGWGKGDNNIAKRSEVRLKISNSLKGKPSGMLGKTHSEETKEKQKNSNKGQKRSQETIDKIKAKRKTQTGSRCPNWKGGISKKLPERKRFSDTIEYKNFRKKCFRKR